MSPNALHALAQRTLAHAIGEAQVSVVGERSLVSRFARSRATQATSVDDVTVEVLALADGQTALASTNRTDEQSLRDTARAAHAAAAAAARAGSGDYPGLPGTPGPGAGDASAPVAGPGHDAETAALDPRSAGEQLRAAFAAAERSGVEAFGIWTAGEVSTAIASTSGATALESVTDAHMKVICRDAGGRSGYAATTAVGIAALDGEALARRAAGKIAPAEPLDLEPGAYPVVLDADAVGTLLAFLGELAFNGLAQAEGRGALVGRLGTRVAAAAINLSDSPAFPRTLPRSFDAEGVRKAPLPLIQDGVAHAVVHDTRSAARAGGAARSTGHALVPGGAGWGPCPTNLVLAGGGAGGVEELAAPIERGIYVTRLWYVNPVDEKRTLLTGTTRDGTFLIEDGRIARPLRDVRFTDSVLRILSATEALGAQSTLTAEPELYDRRFASGVVCPPLRADGFRVTGATRS